MNNALKEVCGALSNLPPEYLIVICSFTYASGGKTRYLPNEVRRFLAGKAHQLYEKKKRRGLPEIIAEKIGSEVLIPLHFSLIKFPVKIGGRLSNAAVGAIMVYQLATLDRDMFIQICNAIYKELSNRFKEFEITLMAGYEVSIKQ